LINDIKTWVFGTTSELSKKIISNVEEPILFGRHNVDYSDPDKFIKEHVVDDTPIEMIVNIHLPHVMGSTTPLSNINEFNNLFVEQNSNIFFFYKLLTATADMKKPVKICFITSTFPNTSIKRLKEDIPSSQEHIESVIGSNYYFSYASSRAIQQFAFFSRTNEYTKSVGVSPSGINESNIDEYAKIITDIVKEDRVDKQWGCVYDLSRPEGWWFFYG
tara:strand:- start:1142 stop:1795 length:654 start_codon:yes stop_codon:yes gene_type:complete